jgi:RNA polymerase-binding transcription factor DksA
MEILEVKEDFPEKGQFSIEVEMTEEEKEFLIEYAFNDILRKGMESMKLKCFNCGEDIDKDTLEKYPDTEICRECIDMGY